MFVGIGTTDLTNQKKKEKRKKEASAVFAIIVPVDFGFEKLWSAGRVGHMDTTSGM